MNWHLEWVLNEGREGMKKVIGLCDNVEELGGLQDLIEKWKKGGSLEKSGGR